MKTLVISHFYNEEFFLPYWLKTHLPLFDHGVLIDYQSTDRSVEICRGLAPHWEVRQSRNAMFAAVANDEEVMDIERNYDGWWKIALNITEFLLLPDGNLKNYIAKFPSGTVSVRTKGVLMIDSPKDIDKDVLPNIPLEMQRHWGKVEDPYGVRPERCRIIHNRTHGDYWVGRHQSRLSYTHIPGCYCLWWGFSPWNIQRVRRLRAAHKIPPSDVKAGMGETHVYNLDQHERLYREYLAGATDLRKNMDYLTILASYARHLGVFPTFPIKIF